MTFRNRLPEFRSFVELLLIAAFYILTARLAFFIALPPNNVAALWIHAGLALAALLIFGRHASIGIFVGSFFANWGMLTGPAAIPVALVIAAGSTLQAWLAAALLRRFITPIPPRSIQLTLAATGIIALTALISPIIGIPSLAIAGSVTWDRFYSLFSTWWISNFIGILIFTPTPVVLAIRARKQPFQEPFLWPLTSFTVGLALFAFFAIQNYQQQQMANELQDDVVEMTSVIAEAIDEDVQAIVAMHAFYSSSEDVSEKEFITFTAPFLEHSSVTSGLFWAPRVSEEERTEFEQSLRQQGQPDFSIYELDSAGKRQPPSGRDAYFPITWIEPFGANQAAVGFDIGSNPARLEAMLRARDSGTLAATAPIQLVQDPQKQTSIIMLMPVYHSSASTLTIADRRDHLLGYAAGIYRMSILVENALLSINRHDAELYLYDVTEPDAPEFLAFYPSVSGPQSLSAQDAPAPASLQTGQYAIQRFNIGNRDWLTIIRPGQSYGAGLGQWVSWISLVVGMLLAGGFLAYVNSRQQTEDTLARSEAEFRNLSDSALTGVIRVKLSGEIIYANQALAEMAGYNTPEDMMQVNLRAFFSDHTLFDTLHQEFLTSPKIRNQEMEIVTVNGEKRQILLSAALLQKVISATIVDITDRIRSEKEIRQLSRVVSQMADTVAITDIDGAIEYINPAFEELTGYSRAEVIGSTPRILKSGRHSEAFYKQMWDTILSGKVFQSEVINRKKNGDLYYETKTITPIRDANGTITNFVATGKDVTEQRKTEETLRRREEEYHLISENTGDVIWLLDIETERFTFVSPSVEKLRGYTPQEVIEQPLSEVMTPDSLAITLAKLPERIADYQRARKTVTYTDEIDQLRKDGSIVNTEVATTFVINSAGKLQIVGISRDITERKQAALLQEAVYRITEAVHTSDSMQDLYPQIHQQISRVMYAENFYIAMYDEEKDLCRFVYSVDEKDPWSTEPFHPGAGLTAHVLRTGQTLLFTLAAQDVTQNIDLIGTPSKTWLGVPLIVHGKTIGVMAVQHYADPHAFTEREQHILEFVSSQIATAIDRKRASELLQSSQASLEMAQSIAHLGNWDLEPGEGPGYWSKEMFQLFRRDPALGTPQFSEFLEMIHPDDRKPLVESQAHAVETNAPAIIDYRSNPALGEVRYFHSTAHPIKDEQGRLVKITGTLLDITESKRALDQLRESERKLKQAQQIAHIGSWEVNIRSLELKWSDEVFRIFGYEPQSFIPTRELFLSIVAPEDRALVQQASHQAVESGTPYEIVYRALRQDGSIAFVVEKGETYLDENAAPVHIMGTVQDITERRKMELEIRERVKELTCLFSVSRLLEDPFASEEVLCQQIIDQLVSAMQFPHLAVPIIALAGKVYSEASRQADPSHGLTAPIVVNAINRGSLSVYYSEHAPFILPEEQYLIDNIARMLGLWLERKESEAALRASDERFRQLANNIQEVFWMLDMAGRKMVYISPAYEMIWGRTCQSLYDNALEYLEGIYPEDQHIMRAAMERQAQGERTEMEYRILQPDGSIRWVWDRSFPIFDEAGKLVRTAGVATDITALKTAQRELEALNRELEKRVEERTAEVRQSEATYRALFEKSNDGIFLIAPSGDELLANQRALDMLGYTAEEYSQISRTKRNPMTPDDQQADAEARLAAVLRGDSVPLYERTFIRSDGKPVNTEINLSAVRDENGQVILVQSVVRDITERKKAEEALRESRDKLSAANAALEKASRMKDEFLASMSHELRTPLTGILGLSEALQLQTQGTLTERQLRSIKMIESSGRHLLELINDILDLSKIEAGKLDLQIEPCSASDICQASLQLVKGMAQQKKQNVSFSMNPVSIPLNVDARRLKQMLVNLMSNAVKFTPEGGKWGLEVEGSPEESQVALTVWDQGIGIKPENMGKLFKPFIQLDSSLSRQYSGTGLGLSLVQRMADLHGGSIKVESVYGEGSRFTILLPWAVLENQQASEPIKADTGPLKNTMVIEDSYLDADHVSRYLHDLGITSVVHPMMQGALESAAALHPSVILLDLYLPDGFGLDLLAELKNDPRTRAIPVVITSVEERRTEARQLGAAGYLVKPFTQADLQTELAKVTARTPFTEPVLLVSSSNFAPLVIVADDNEVILDMVTDFLEAKKFRVVAVRSGFELLDRAPELRPNIILMDIQMPGLDGMEATRRLRAHNDPSIACTPVIAITALAMTGDREKCLEAGANDYMSKPISLTQLVQKINQLLPS